MKLKFTVEMPAGRYCLSETVDCPCCGADDTDVMYCFRFHLPLSYDDVSNNYLKCSPCQKMTEKLIKEERNQYV